VYPALPVHILVNISLKLAQAWRMDIVEPGLKQISLWINEEFGEILENKPNRTRAALGHC